MVKFLSQKNLSILHCNSSYPAQSHQLNLRYMEKLHKMFNKSVIGYSGHESSVLPSLIAISLGAIAVERHITIDRTLWGTDQSASLESTGIKSMVDGSLRVNTIIGSGNKKTLKLERSKFKDMIYWNNK